MGKLYLWPLMACLIRWQRSATMLMNLPRLLLPDQDGQGVPLPGPVVRVGRAVVRGGAAYTLPLPPRLPGLDALTSLPCCLARMGKVFLFLGLSCAVVQQGHSPVRCRRAFDADVTYTTANSLGFSFLMDTSSALRPEFLVRCSERQPCDACFPGCSVSV